jgi:hypothetical protein
VDEPAAIIDAFMGLQDLFRVRGWNRPKTLALSAPVSGAELLARLDIPEEQVEVIFVNRVAYPLGEARIAPGDRVALCPPGVPGPHRVLLGFKNPGGGV